MKVLIIGAGAQGNVINWVLSRSKEVMEACYNSKTNYQDMATGTTDDFTIEEGTSRELSVDAKWREAGLQALMTTGISPGVTNILIKDAYERMDEVDDIKMRLAGGYSKVAAPVSLWSAYTFILDC